MSFRKSSSSRNGSKSDVFPKPKARRRCTPAPSRVGLDLTSRLTGRMDILASSTESTFLHTVTANAQAVPLSLAERGLQPLLRHCPLLCALPHPAFPSS